MINIMFVYFFSHLLNFQKEFHHSPNKHLYRYKHHINPIKISQFIQFIFHLRSTAIRSSCTIDAFIRSITYSTQILPVRKFLEISYPLESTIYCSRTIETRVKSKTHPTFILYFSLVNFSTYIISVAIGYSCAVFAS